MKLVQNKEPELEKRKFLRKLGLSAVIAAFSAWAIKNVAAGNTYINSSQVEADKLIIGTGRSIPVSHTPGVAGTATLNLAVGTVHDITMPAGNITIAVSNEQNGHIFTVRILQDSVGSRTVTWFSTIKWAGGSAPTLTTTSSKADTFIFRCTGAGAFDGFIVGQNI